MNNYVSVLSGEDHFLANIVEVPSGRGKLVLTILAVTKQTLPQVTLNLGVRATNRM
jgi:hypothetical protein